MIFALAALVACHDHGKETGAASPEVSILSPQEGEQVAAGTSLQVAMIVEHMELAEATGLNWPAILLPGAPARAHSDHPEETGYVVLGLDGAELGQYAATNVDVGVLPTGAHSLTATLYYSDGHETGAEATVGFEVLAP
jgi:hypothetical protein